MGLTDLLLPDESNEFECNDCGYSFTKEPRPGETPTCPECDSYDLAEV